MKKSELVLLVATAAVGVAAADIFTDPLPGLEGLYGGFIGDTDKETTYDFETAFLSVDNAWLHLEGFTDVGQSFLTFTPGIEGELGDPFTIFVGEGDFHVDLPLPLGDGLLDGMGMVYLNLDTSGPGADLSSSVTEAVLYFDAVVPEPASLALLGLGGLLALRRR